MPIERFNEPIVIQINVCTKNRRPILANNNMHSLVRQVWEEATAWRVGTYMIMPEHIHLFCAPGQIPIFSLKNWVAYWKRWITRRIPGKTEIWQKDFWDTQMRGIEHYRKNLAYVRLNPVRKGLVRDTRDWPYQGEIFKIRW